SMAELTIATLIISGLAALTGSVLAENAGKSKVRGMLDGLALGAGFAIAISCQTWRRAFLTGFLGAVFVGTVDTLWNHFYDKDAPSDGTTFDCFESFSWGFLDGAIEVNSARMPPAVADAFKTLGLNVFQALVNGATSNKPDEE